MCWIFWYIGNRPDAQSILLHWLEKLEYRGYDSAWMYIWNSTWTTQLIKAVWKVSNLSNKLNIDTISETQWNYWIAHTRRATHWWVTIQNTHPHHDNSSNFHIVHNWIIENYHKLKLSLIDKWYKFYSDTDTEIIANLLNDLWDWDFLSTVEKVLSKIKWAYALLIISKHNPNEMIAVKFWSPLILATNQNNDFYFSSDKNALSRHVQKIIHMDDWDIVYIKDSDYKIIADWVHIARKEEDFTQKNIETSKWEFEHFMLKEIYEQANIINRIFKWRIDFTNKTMNTDAFHWMKEEKFNKIVFVWCWTSYNAGLLWTYYMENLAWIESISYIASEYEYQNIKVNDETLFVFISQSWETADSIEVLKLLKNKWAKTFWIVNVVWSSISRLTDYWLFTRAGAEIWVASTKAFTAQITCIILLALFLWQKRWLNKAKYDKILSELKSIPTKIDTLLQDIKNIKQIWEKLSEHNSFFFLWRHYQLPIARESSLKFKEITYLHSEFYPTGELKHWPLALIDKKVPSILFLPNDILFEKNLSSMQEIKARDWIIVTISDKEITWSDHHISLPESIDELYPFLWAVVWQLLAYYTAKKLWRDIDKPRNLAKSVTVK